MTAVEIGSIASSTFLAGGWIVNILTVKSQRKKALAEAKKSNAEAEGAEIDNATKIVNMWEQLMNKKSATDDDQITALNNRILDLENLVKSFQKTVEKFTKALTKAKECPGVENCIILRELKDKES